MRGIRFQRFSVAVWFASFVIWMSGSGILDGLSHCELRNIKKVLRCSPNSSIATIGNLSTEAYNRTPSAFSKSLLAASYRGIDADIWNQDVLSWQAPEVVPAA